MAKSLRSKKEKRLRAIRREIVEPFYDKKEAAMLAAQEAALAEPKLQVSLRSNTAMDASTSTNNTNMGILSSLLLYSLPSASFVWSLWMDWRCCFTLLIIICDLWSLLGSTKHCYEDYVLHDKIPLLKKIPRFIILLIMYWHLVALQENLTSCIRI